MLSFLIQHLVQINSLYEVCRIILILKLLNYVLIRLIDLMNITTYYNILSSFFINGSILLSFSNALFSF